VVDTAGFDDLLAAAKAGDEAAFVALFRSVQPVLLRYLVTLGGSGLAEDAAADTWLSVVRGLPDFSGDEAGWRAWVFTIAHSRLRDAQRRASRQPVPVDVRRAFAGLPALDDVPLAVEELITTEAALALIGRLPHDQAEAVLLRHVAGLDVARTAEVLGKRPGAVRVATHRGLQRLAQMSAPAFDDRLGRVASSGV
jgi:RNA polymerase sigma-70 factor, ECF subfamily